MIIKETDSVMIDLNRKENAEASIKSTKKCLSVYKANTFVSFDPKEMIEDDVFVIVDETGIIKAVVNLGGSWFELKDDGFLEDLQQQGTKFMDLIHEDGIYNGYEGCFYQEILDSMVKLPKVMF